MIYSIIKKMNKIWTAAVLLVCLAGATACGKDAADVIISGSTSADSTESGQMINIKLYYLDENYSDYSYDEMSIDQLTTTESIIDTVMNRLITSPEDSKQIPIADGMTYQRYTYDGENNVTLVFNVDYQSSDSYEILLSKSAFTNTLCQIDGVSSVTFELTDLLNDQEEVSETYSTDSFAYLDDYGITSEFKSRIYYPNIDGSGLIEDYVTLDASSNESLEQQIVEYLYKGDGKNYVGSISSDTAINMISVSDGVCFLDFSKEFLDGIEGINYDLILYSIVDSLTVLKNVNSVDISVDGNRQLMLGENIDLSLSYESDLSYVK